ncbi:hypothetical protein CAEBREN_18239 [Caenorhabditis brenneri]|uniref:ShKT domain-containing protein n=1 Tax=Caenorhabditis brenneri TaxID=135651 RepID=G0P4D1_CAEBE|nr:hypothetical protein CAEBREN_18239 [Caenorhabditis brenneri]
MRNRRKTEKKITSKCLPLKNCRDRTNLCWRWIDRCKSFFFEQIMKEFCALSCGYCTPKALQTAKASPPNYSNTMLTKSSTSYLQHG